MPTSSVLVRPTRSMKHTPALCSGQVISLKLKLAVNENVLHPLGKLIGILVRSLVDDRGRIEDGDISKVPLSEQAPVAQVFPLGRQRGHLPYSLLQG